MFFSNLNSNCSKLLKVATGEFFHCQHKYSKSLSQAENSSFPPKTVSNLFKFSSQDSDLEYICWRRKNFPLYSDLKPPLGRWYIFVMLMQGLLNQMDRTLRTLAKFESSKPGLILGTQITPRGWIFWTINFYHQKIQVKIYLMRGQTLF